MLTRFLKKSAPAPSDAPAAARAPEPARVAPGGILSADGGTGEDLEGALRAEVSARCEALHDVLRGAPGSAHAEQLLRRLTESFDLVIRQPPPAAQRALEVSRNPDSSVVDLVRLVERDPTLTQGLLKYANSALMATSGKSVLSLNDAVNRIGAKGVQIVVLGCMVEGLLCRPGPGYDKLVELVWSHMVRTAPLARRIAPAFEAPGEETFALALLHDVGKLVLFDRIAALRGEQKKDVALPDGFLDQALGALHEPLGGLAALRWGLGDRAVRAIATHHRDPAPAARDVYTEVLFVAEKADIAAVKQRELALDAWWAEGAITASQERVGAALAAASAA